MILIIIIAVIALVFGLLLLLSPGTLIKMNEELNRMVTKIDEQVLRYRVGVGVSLLLAAAFLFVYAYMLGHR